MTIKRKKPKKQAYDPKVSELKRTLRFAVSKLKPEEIEEVEGRVHKVAKKHYKKDREGNDPSKWRFYFGKEWNSYGLKEILNIRAGRPINDYRAGLLTRTDLWGLVDFFGIEISEPEKISRSELWSQIVVWVRENEDSRMNRLKKLWGWLEERLDDSDVEYLMVNAPGYWNDARCYLDPDWRLRHLSNIFEITYMIQEVADAKLKTENRTPVVSGMSKLQLWAVAQKIMDLQLPNNATKEIMWQKILEKIDLDKAK